MGGQGRVRDGSREQRNLKIKTMIFSAGTEKSEGHVFEQVFAPRSRIGRALKGQGRF